MLNRFVQNPGGFVRNAMGFVRNRPVLSVLASPFCAPVDE
jgi:hypothetical protein